MPIGTLDATITTSKNALLEHKLKTGSNQSETEGDLAAQGNPLAVLGDDETLYLDGHGTAPEDLNHVPQAAVRFGDYQPEELAKRLKAKGLPATYRGKIYLNGCNTGTGMAGKSYAYRFQKKLLKLGWSVPVKANRGYSQVQSDTGHTWVNPATVAGAKERATLDKLGSEAQSLQDKGPQYLKRAQKLLDTMPPTSERTALIEELAVKMDDNHKKLLLKSNEVSDQKLRTFLPDKGLKLNLPAPAPKKGGCFLTTACVAYKGLADNCEELTVLRAFRDQYMLTLPDGPALVDDYYRLAPTIVHHIWEDEGYAEVLEGIYQTVRRCVQLIQLGHNAAAMNIYTRKVLDLREKYL
ncbi:MAG: hypothetical protein H0T73_03705 [Ardenticatenales bacterium]|nr:hypothetical protein [Ardenticatenales bacterium]